MKIERLQIKNFKSIWDIEIRNPSSFSVFVGPNGAGKSNIFEALELAADINVAKEIATTGVLSLYGGGVNLDNFIKGDGLFYTLIKSDKNQEEVYSWYYSDHGKGLKESLTESAQNYDTQRKGGFSNGLGLSDFSRVFVKNRDLLKKKRTDDVKLALDASNLEKVLGRILSDPEVSEEFIEYLQLFIPGLEKVEVRKRDLSDGADLLVKETAIERPLNKNLISDGTYNIIALLTALFQSKEPQFLCIEEPENGLNPKVIQEFVKLCRDVCERYGHIIWLNTHSQSLVSQLEPEELILVEKVDGETQVRQLSKDNITISENFKMDEAWLTNVLGGGLPW